MEQIAALITKERNYLERDETSIIEHPPSEDGDEDVQQSRSSLDVAIQATEEQVFALWTEIRRLNDVKKTSERREELRLHRLLCTNDSHIHML